MEAHTDDYDYINEESIDKHLQCSICTRPFLHPTLTKCKPNRHTFCYHCIEEWIEHNPSCPICRQQLNSQDLTLITDGPLIGILNELKIRCKFCQQSGIQRGNFADHINKTCPKVNISCSSADIKCPWTGSRDQLNQHLSTCMFNPLRPLITQLQKQINNQQTEIEQLKSQITPLESKFIDTISLRFLTSKTDFAARRKRRILKIPNP
jgi:hypothetical protein